MSSCALHHHVFEICICPGLPVLSVVRSEPNHTCTRPRHVRNIILLVAGKCSRNGLKVGMRCRFVVSRPPAKFHRIRSPFDVPTDKYSGNSSRSNVGRFRSPETVAGPPSLLFSQLETVCTAHLVHPPSPLRFRSCPMRSRGPKPSLHSASNPSRERPKAVPDPTRTVVTAVSGSSPNICKISSFYYSGYLTYLFTTARL